MSKFKEIGVAKDLCKGINEMGFINPTEVQGSEDIMGAEGVIWPQFTQNPMVVPPFAPRRCSISRFSIHGNHLHEDGPDFNA